MSRSEIEARQRTLDLIGKPIELSSGSFGLSHFDPNRMLESHPDPETALKIRQQMDEIAVLIERMNEREQAGNRVIVLSATAFLVTSCAYVLYQLNDVNTSFTASLPSLFTLMNFSTARKILCRLAAWDLLPVDFGSEDPYMIRTITRPESKTRPLRICVPIGLGAGIEVNCLGPAGFLKFGFGSIEVGPVSVEPQPPIKEGGIQIIGSSLAYDLERADGSEGLEVVADRLCKYMEARPNDLLTRNCVCGISISIKSSSDIDKVFSNTRLLALADYVSLDVGGLNNEQIKAVIVRIDELSRNAESLPQLFLKVDLTQSLPPSHEVVHALNRSSVVSGVNVNGVGVAAFNTQITNFSAEKDIHVRGQIVKEKSTEAVSNWFKVLKNKEVIASGGVYSGRDAMEKIEAGASLVNVFTSFVTDGPPVARRIKTQLSVQLMNKGYYDLEEVIGSKHRIASKRLQDAMRRRKKF
jgi:dihydroorotate dehydrogenase